MQKKLNALVDADLVKKLHHALIDDDLAYAEWLRRAIGYYLAQKAAEVDDPFALGGKTTRKGAK